MWQRAGGLRLEVQDPPRDLDPNDADHRNLDSVPGELDDLARKRLAWSSAEARDDESDDFEDFDEEDFDDDFDDDFEEEQDEEY